MSVLFRDHPGATDEITRVEIQLNGEPRTITDGANIADLLAELKLNPKYLAVERNFELVPRKEHAACLLKPGDHIEIVTLVGGG